MKSIFLTFIPPLFFLMGCFTGRPTPTQPGLLSSTSTISINQLSTDPSVYAVSLSPDQKIFATTVKECDVKDYTPNNSFVRELFVGFDRPVIRSQESIEVDSRPLTRSTATASLDTESVEILAYTYREHGCVLDILFWSRADQPIPLDRIEPYVVEILS